MDYYNDNWFLFGGSFNTYKNRIEDALKKYYRIFKKNVKKK